MALFKDLFFHKQAEASDVGIWLELDGVSLGMMHRYVRIER